MTPGKFLRLVWPDEGLYCIAHQFMPEGATSPAWYHKVFPTLTEAASHCLLEQNKKDVWFAVLSLKQKEVWNPKKKNWKTGELGAFETRPKHNMLAAKALFWDLDVGDAEDKYPTRDDAVRDLVRFLREAKLPLPMLVSSGSGIHVYWYLAETVSADRWLAMATQLKQLGTEHKVRLDPSRTTDQSSVLRVVGTMNWKDKHDPKPVEILGDTTGQITPAAQMEQLLSEALIRTGATPETPRTPVAPGGDNPFGSSNTNMQWQDFGPPPSLKDVAKSCGQVAAMVMSHEKGKPYAMRLGNEAWHKGFLTTFSHFENGPDICRKMTEIWPRNNVNVEAKLEQVSTIGPASCTTIADKMPWGDAPCKKCAFYNDPSTPNPLVAARKTVTAPPPIVEVITPGTGPIPALIPNPPKPYKRLATGEVARVTVDKDNNETVEIIFDCDLYPIRRLVDTEAAEERHIWRVNLPREGVREFVLEAEALYDTRKFCAAIANNGVYPDRANLGYLQDYMTHYIKQLQKVADADRQSTRLGWTDDYNKFVTPEKTLLADGTAIRSALSKSATNAAQAIRKKGTLEAQVALMRFYNHRAYIPNQFAILCSLASVIFYATGQHGIVVNMSGDAGASKSTTLYTASSVWGSPEGWPINGTNKGATSNARANRPVINGNYPTLIDEITHLPSREAIDLVMNITQPGDRLRLGQDGAERKTDVDSYKSAIMVASANSTLHGLLATDNAAGTAGSMRVFEMKFAAQSVHTKAQADEFLRQLNQNYGHIGDVFVPYVIQNRAKVEALVQQYVREIDEEGHIRASERFWSAVIAAVLAAADIARQLGLLTYETAPIREWVLKEQIPFMRGTVSEEYRNPLQMLTDYLAEKSGNILVMEKDQFPNSDGYSIADVKSALLGHYDKKSGCLYLLKQGIRDYCRRLGTSHTRMIEELHQPRHTANGRRIIFDKDYRTTLGKGTNLAKGQQYCYAVDMTHPDIAGAVPVLVDISSPADTIGKQAND